MDRRFVYVGAIPQDIDVLQSNLDPYIGVSKLADAVLGKTQILNNFACTPTSPAGMTVNVGYGEIYSLQQIDTSTYGTISPYTYQIVKQGITFNTTNLSCPAPVTTGYSINYLIEVSFTETDTNSVVLFYYNSSNINAPLSGPGGSGTPQNTVRQDGVTITLKAGTAAPTGTQTTPSPDSGYTGAYVVTVAYGQTTIISGNISQYSSSSFIKETLIQKVSQTTGDLRWSQIQRIQTDYYNFGSDTGTANTYVTSLTPTLLSYSPGLRISLVVGNTNTGASTLNVNGLGGKNIILTNGATPSAGDIVSGQIAQFEYDGTNFQILNPPRLITALQIQDNSFTYSVDTGSANAYLATLSPAIVSYTAGINIILKIANTNTGASTLNVNSVGLINIKRNDGNNLSGGDIQAGMLADLRFDGTNFQLMNPAFAIQSVNVQGPFTSSGAGTYTPSLGMKYVLIQCQAGGGGGGGAATTTLGQIATAGGGGGGEYAEAVYTASQIGSSKPYVIGSGGAGGLAGANNGTAGGNSTFNSTWIVTNGGSAGIGIGASTQAPQTLTAFVPGGFGGSVSTGQGIKILAGGYGGAGISLTTTNGYSGGGGNAGCGSAGSQPIISTSGIGATGGQGAGGSGAMTAGGTQKPGGAGINGYIVFIEYIGY